MSNLLSFEELKKATGCKNTPSLEKCLRAQKVSFLYGREGIFTTTDALNAAMGIKSAEIEHEPVEFIR